MSRVAEWYFPEVYGDYDDEHRKTATIVDLAKVKAGSKIRKGAKPDKGKSDGEGEEVKAHEDLIYRYYQVFLELVDAAGSFSWIILLDKNVEEGIYPTQKVKYDYFPNEAAFQTAKQDRRQACWRLVNELNNLSRGLGLGSYDREGCRLFVNHLVNSDRRRAWYKKCLKKYQAILEPYSIDELWERRIELDKKLRAKRSPT